MTFYGFTILRI